MVGTREGSLKAHAKMKEKYGEEGYHNFFREIGRKGGLVCTPNGGFASDKVGADGLTGRQRARIAGKKGGAISRRTGVKNHQGATYRQDDIDKIERILEEDGGRD